MTTHVRSYIDGLSLTKIRRSWMCIKQPFCPKESKKENRKFWYHDY